MKLYVMCGIPNSGKSTKAEKLSEELNLTLIHHDTYYPRIITPNIQVTLEHLNTVTELALSDVKNALLNGENVVYDATNDTKESRKRVLDICAIEDCQYICIYMNTPLEICLARDKMGWSRLFAERFEMPSEDEGFDEIIYCNDGFSDEDI